MLDLQGNVTLENCTLRGACLADNTKNGEKDVGSWKGFYVAPQGKLFLKQCNVINFDVGLRVRAAGQVVLSTSEVSSCNIGILVRFLKLLTSRTVILIAYTSRRKRKRPFRYLTVN